MDATIVSIHEALAFPFFHFAWYPPSDTPGSVPIPKIDGVPS
jgi:hypothetical protein